MADIPFPRGVRDFMPNEAIFRNRLIERIEGVYRGFGFLPIYTPAIEALAVLRAKDVIGEENKLIFELKDQEGGLRYDHTVGLARYISMHSSMPLPFKRYAIGPVWRMDEPQRLRYREFSQADVDILGGDPYKANAEIIEAVGKAMDAIGLNYRIRLNSRLAVDRFLEGIGIKKGLEKAIMRAIDKRDKIGLEGVEKELEEAGLARAAIEKILEFISFKGSNKEKLDFLEHHSGSKEAVEEIEETLRLAEVYKIKGAISIDFSVVRGIDYYTGMVMETVDSNNPNDLTSLCSGGRYDNLVSTFGSAKLPGVGASIGVDRVMDALGFRESKQKSYAEVFVAFIKDKNYGYALKVANYMRDKGIAVDLNIAARNISNQLSYASSLSIPYAAIIGDDEERNNILKLRDMGTGAEKKLTMEDACKEIIGAVG
ncbi:histidine--tRNA ligase [Candidatus Marsarchaeota archaeon]|nr:histidine--tRNA ligase [Candidatus Marsarchaeota archaeon]